MSSNRAAMLIKYKSGCNAICATASGLLRLLLPTPRRRQPCVDPNVGFDTACVKAADLGDWPRAAGTRAALRNTHGVGRVVDSVGSGWSPDRHMTRSVGNRQRTLTITDPEAHRRHGRRCD